MESEQILSCTFESFHSVGNVPKQNGQFDPNPCLFYLICFDVFYPACSCLIHLSLSRHFMTMFYSVFQTEAADPAAPCPDQRERAESRAGAAQPEGVAG